MVEFMLTYYLGNVELMLENMEFETNIGLFYNLEDKQKVIQYSSQHKETCRNLLRTLEEENGQK